MSIVTDVLLLLSLREDFPLHEGVDPSALPISALKLWLSERGYIDINLISNHVAGGKVFQANAYAGAYNMFDLKGFLQQIEHQTWVCPDAVQLLVKLENETTFQMYMFKETTLTPLLPFK